MTDRELMQQALDAMLNFPNDISDEMFESIKALRARLAQPEPYAAQAAMVAQQTQGRMRIDPVTGDVGIGTVEWDASAPLVVHPHPAFQATQPQREWQRLTDEEISEVLGSDIHDEPSGELRFIRAIEAKLKEKNT